MREPMTALVPFPRCRNCDRRIEKVDGVGWLHPDDRIYFVQAIEPQCEVAEPALALVQLVNAPRTEGL